MAELFDVRTPKRGATPLFGPYHLLKALFYLRDEGPLGRKGLAELVGIGEGSARGLCDHLEDCKMAKQTASGITLRGRGRKYLEKIGLAAAKVDAVKLTVDEHDFALKLSGLADKVTNGIKQRDEAIKAEAGGATTILFKGGKLILPDHFEVASANPNVAKELAGIFDFEENDVLIIGTGKSEKAAADGAFAAAVSLLLDEKY